MTTEAKRSETMASQFNITEKQFNGTDYDTLYPKNTSQQSLLNDSALATKLSLTGDVDVNDALNVLADLVLGKAQVEVGSYTGNNALSVELTFNHKPRLLWVFNNSGTSPMFDIVQPISGYTALYDQFIVFNPSTSNTAMLTTVRTSVDSNGGYILNVTWNYNNNKTKVRWVRTDDATHAFNANNTNYAYIAITCD